MTLFDLLDEREMADTSLEVYHDRILPTLQKRELAVLMALYDYQDATGYGGATGGELTEWMKSRGLARDVNGVRPRLTGLSDKGWVQSGSARKCRAYGTAAHPYWPTLPREAVERAMRTQCH